MTTYIASVFPERTDEIEAVAVVGRRPSVAVRVGNLSIHVGDLEVLESLEQAMAEAKTLLERMIDPGAVSA